MGDATTGGPTGGREPVATDSADGRSRRRRLALLLLLLLVVVIGAGIGTFVGDGPDDPSPPVVTVTPTDTPGGDTQTPGTATPPTASVPTTETPTATATPGTGGSESDGNDRGRTDSGGSGGAGGGGGNSDDPGVRLEAVGSTAILGYDDVAPGHSGREELRLRNGGTRGANLSVANVTVSDAENGIVGPESAVDDTPDRGELSASLFVVLAAERPDGSTEYLYGTGTGARSLRSIANETEPAVAGRLGAGQEATVVVEWRVPGSVGNEIQTDGAEVDLAFALRSGEP